MTTKRTIALGLAAAAVTTMVAVPTFANSYSPGEGERKRPNPEMIEQKKLEMAEHREAVEAAIDANDYEAWLEAVGERPIAEQVTADEFDQLREIHRLKSEARALMEEAKEIADEIGIEPPHRGHRMTRGMKKGFRAGRHFQAIQE